MLGMSSTVRMLWRILASRFYWFYAEPFNDNGTYREDVFYNTLGTSYIPIGLRAARSGDPNAKLYINEYNNEYIGTACHLRLPFSC